ncbi:unnamed protein product [Ilex paraguariensis]|uniref:Smr domain-containing protein n=1 Tax=Ilex paraguariensis TaxID=185542 RepID=A0ABC8S970_9AQUA
MSDSKLTGERHVDSKTQLYPYPSTDIFIDITYASVLPSLMSPNSLDWGLFHMNQHQKNMNLGGITDCVDDDFDGSDMIPSEKYDEDEANLEELINYVKNCNIEEEIIEPERRRENDIYMIQRKDALRMEKLSSLHAKASRDAYQKGDYFTAQGFSLKAQAGRMVAEILHAKAAKEIFYIKNRNNDIWKLDLHGLHAKEAVQALGEHLYMIESQEFVSLRQKRRFLLVITGRGNHSRGQPVLPSAIRNFLNENQYYYDDSRPGVIKVQPKFSPGIAADECLTANHLQEQKYFPPLQLHAYVML